MTRDIKNKGNNESMNIHDCKLYLNEILLQVKKMTHIHVHMIITVIARDRGKEGGGLKTVVEIQILPMKVSNCTCLSFVTLYT